ncbi:MobA-like NTP transferase domain-containing protein [Flexibacter flexilis DSM 6793]|uniref:MobA-like NTP transferase domain-containing protein n=1 Tax=Flexibacter flexilis DSM 6793 TaxID=927664 RepID=A0A1I1H028_9BACT|nr:glycosyltransferase family 2 protein [Flexibacter flexilis]SFC17407.1 MobA-like NTP transferase domain-containing protein [Flexibacter flexilis DSM 6793]
MQIIIPLSGEGSRFVRAGYKDIKPLIPVHGKPIIEWVCNLFPNEDNFLFVVREEHVNTTPVVETLQRLKPTAQIRTVKGEKSGPAGSIVKVLDAIDDNEPCIVSYCDYFQDWDYEDFKKTVLADGCEGAIPCYTGFHPHLLPAINLYASCKTDENGYLTEIREKFAWNADKKLDKHSSGMYYFKSGALLKKYYQQQIAEDVNLNGEYYASLTYNLLVRDGLKVLVYDKIPHFCQWGTPQDLEEYNYWSEIFESLALKPQGH